ncbi:MAG: CerR family C-terminal domain-containing protein [Acidobacteriota bacterium]|jgi:AcrR family transcriptional regulator
MTETPPTPPGRPAPNDTASRGDATREALINAGIELFGRHGYHATGNRALAEAAGVNAALIGYHFGGKRGLYLATFEAIAEGMTRRLGPVAESIETELEGLERDAERGRLDRQDLRDRLPLLLHRLLDGLVAMLTAEESGPWARLIVREQMDPSDALDILYERVLGRMLALATRLIRTIAEAGETGQSGENGENGEDGARMTALTVIGQALVFRVARATVLRHLGWDGIGPERVELIQRRVRDNATAILHALHEESAP